MEPGAANQPLELVIKNPTSHREQDFKLTISPLDTLAQLKAALQALYPGSPDPAALTVRPLWFLCCCGFYVSMFLIGFSSMV